MTKRSRIVAGLAMSLALSGSGSWAQNGSPASGADVQKAEPVTYRVVYTITELDEGKRIGVQHFAMVVLTGKRTELKDGTKVPIATGTGSGSQTQFTYVSIGLNFTTTLDQTAAGLQLTSRVQQSSAIEQKPISGVAEPIIREADLETSLILVPGRPLMIGSIDVPGSTRRLDVEVLAEQVK